MSDDRTLMEAEALDRTIDGALGYEEVVPDDELGRLVRHLAVIHRAPVPDELGQRVARSLSEQSRPSRRRTRLPLRGLAAVLGALFLVQGAPAVFASARLAEFLGFVHEPHIYTEAGIMALAVGAVLILASVRPRWLDAAVVVGVPISLALGIFGIYEIGHAPNPAAELLHLAQALVAVGLGVGWWASRRRTV